jgi:nitrogen fixation/metabolism regulation signal transduction histidine kinase
MSMVPASDRVRPPRRAGIQVKLTVLLLAVALAPLLMSAFLVDQISRVAQNFASNEAAELRPPLEASQRVYRELIDAKKALYGQVALRLAAAPEVTAAVGAAAVRPPDEGAPPARAIWFDAVVDEVPDLIRASVRDPDGRVIAEAARTPQGEEGVAWRPREVSQRVAGGGSLVLTFAAPAALQEEYAAVSRALAKARSIDRVRRALPASYRKAFLLLVSAVVVAATLIGILLSRRLVRRVAALLAGTRRVAAGDLETRVDPVGSDEIAELARAFDRMVDDLRLNRRQIEYLQRIGAWQDVARKLAHEIKNPLTPIQLAVQQCVSAYKPPAGDPAGDRFGRLLRDTEEIVTEEIANLRRLVDTFRTLGQLPRVEARPIPLATVVDDLTKEPQFAERLRIAAPPATVMVHADRLLLRRVLTNLVENGVQAGVEAGGPGDVVIAWQADPDRGRVRVTVDDAGGGVDAAAREHIFEPYVTTKAHGTGLGLAISKKIALEHGGELEVSPERAPTGGARFVLTLPIAADGGTVAVADGEAPSGSA